MVHSPTDAAPQFFLETRNSFISSFILFPNIYLFLAEFVIVFFCPTSWVNDSADIPTLAVIGIQEGIVKSKILNLKTNKATGPDEVAPRLLRLLGGTVAPPLVSVFTSTFKTGVVPLEWKTAKLTTVHKKDDKTDRGNYRPLSILSVPSKILESCVNDEIVDHVLNSNRLVTDNQWAYRKGYSTELLLVHLTETWRHAIDTGYVEAVAFIDFRKVFDCVDHGILLKKLRYNLEYAAPY